MEKKPEMLVGCVMYCDVIKLLSLLSLALQNESADIVMSIESMLKSAKALTSWQSKVLRTGQQ